MIKNNKKQYVYKLFKVRTTDKKDVDEFNKTIEKEGWEILDFKNRTGESYYTLINARKKS